MRIYEYLVKTMRYNAEKDVETDFESSARIFFAPNRSVLAMKYQGRQEVELSHPHVNSKSPCPFPRK